MIKVIMCLFKKPGISDEEFAKHWKEIHGPMIVRLRPALKNMYRITSSEYPV